jgi:CO/xanthine dehydrogenase FAD-binding subunit
MANAVRLLPTVPRFGYERPSTLSEALEALATPAAVPLSGATDFVTLVNSGALSVAKAVDVKAVPELNALELCETEARIGAAVTCARAQKLDHRGLAALREGASLVGGAQTRNRATIGGNICRASPAGDTLCALLVLGARAQIRARANQREVRLEDFFVGPGKTRLGQGELLTAIHVPLTTGGSAYARFTYRRAMDLAVVGVAAWVKTTNGVCDAAAVALGAVAPTPILVPDAAAALVGSTGEEGTLAACIEALLTAASPIDDVRGTARHRLTVLSPLARRVITRAIARARESERA